MTKWVYRFGDGAAEGRAEKKNLLGGKGAGLAEMSNLGLPVPPGFTITTEVCSYFYAHGKILSGRAAGAGRSRARRDRAIARRTVRRSRQSASCFGALRSARLDAGHDGHRAQPRAQRPGGRGAGASGAATNASPMTAIAASSRCTDRWCSASRIISRSCSKTTSSTTASRSTPISPPTTGGRSSPVSRISSPRNSDARFPRIRRSSCGARSAPSSAHG